MAQILENVDPTKREKFNEKYERLSSKKWTRDNFEKNMREVRQAINNIDDFITGLLDDIEDIEGEKPGEDSDFEEIQESFEDAGGDYDDLLNKTLVGGYNPDLHQISLKHEDSKEKRKRIDEWRTLQLELARLAMDEQEQILESLVKKVRTGKVQQDFQEFAREFVRNEVKTAKKDIKSEMKEEVAELEQAVNAARNETKNAWAFLQKFAEVRTDNDELLEITEEAVQEGLEQYATEDGLIDLSGQAQKAEDRKSDRDSARESALEDVGKNSGEDQGADSDSDGVETKYYLKGKELEDQHEVLQRMAENEDLIETPTYKIAEMTDISHTALSSKSGSLMDRIEEEYGTRFGID